MPNEIRRDLGRLPHRSDLAAARSVHRHRQRRDEGPHAVCDRRAAGQGMGHQIGRLVRADERHGLGRPPLRAGQDPPLGPDGLGGDLRRRQKGHPPHDRSRIADQGPGPRRRPGRGSLRHPRRHDPDQRRRSRRRDAAHLQRMARRFLQHPPRSLCRARLHPESRHRRRGRRDRAGRPARWRARARNLAPPRHGAAVGPVVEPDVGCGRGDRTAVAFPHDRRRHAARLLKAGAEGRARRPRRRHHQLPDVHVGGAVVDDLLRRARAAPGPQGRHRRGRHRLDPLYPAAHGRRVGGPVQGARSEDEAERILAAPVLRHLSDRPDRRQIRRRDRRGQHHVGLGLPAPRRRLARLAGIHPARARSSKQNPDPVVGLAGLRDARRLTRKPVVAIGGITIERAAEVYAAGADSICVARDLLCAPDPSARAEEYLRIGAEAARP